MEGLPGYKITEYDIKDKEMRSAKLIVLENVY